MRSGKIYFLRTIPPHNCNNYGGYVHLRYNYPQEGVSIVVYLIIGGLLTAIVVFADVLDFRQDQKDGVGLSLGGNQLSLLYSLESL